MWSLHRWVWQVESPLFIGMPPASALNRCRLYVPARAMWAAVTAERARREAIHFPAYADLGERLRENARFTYLYPAEQVQGEWRAWLPHFEFGAGLAWRREGEQPADRIADRKFRRRLLDARPGTAIDPDSDSAEDKSLRETECVLPYWRQGSSRASSPVAFAGYVLLKQGIQDLNDIAVLFLGGDTRYGLGQMRRVEWSAASDLFGLQVDLQQSIPFARGSRLFAHARQHDGEPEIIGAQECLAGWDLTISDRFTPLCEKPLWMPGSRIRDTKGVRDWQICEDGFWRHKRAAASIQ